jgi:IS1 family transposase
MPDRSGIMVTMNRLSTERRAEIVRCLVEGNSIRATCRMTGAAKRTVTRLLVELGAACDAYQDEHLRRLPCKRLQADEIWSFVYAKARNVPDERRGEFGVGDVYTFVAIDADTKLVPSWAVGPRDIRSARAFMEDVASRLASRVQLTTDGHRMYLEAVEGAFGADVDYAQLVKLYSSTPELDHRYSPTECIGAQERVVTGHPDERHISTSFVERQNLTMRMGMRRFTRASNGHSKKLVNHAAAQAIHFLHYNFARPHKSLANPYPRTPAMAAGLAEHVWTCEEMAALLD